MHYVFDKQDEILQHWVRGLGCLYPPYEAIQKTPIDNTISFRSLAKRKIINDCKKSGRTFYYIDTGYVGNLIKKKLWHRVVKNDVQHSNIFNVPEDRWLKIKAKSPELEFVEWRKNHKGKILLVTPSEKPCKYYQIDRDRWVKDTIETLKRYTDREIIIRDKGARHERVGTGSVPWFLIKEKIYATLRKQLTNDKAIAVDADGYNKYFILDGKKLAVENFDMSNVEVKKGTASELKRIFGKSMANRLVSRVVLNKFIQEVA